MDKNETQDLQTKNDVAAQTTTNNAQSIKNGKQENFRYIARVIAGLYLIYLAYQLFTGIRSGSIAEGMQQYVMIGAIILFVATGIFLLVTTARAALRKFKLSMDAMSQMEDEEAKQNTNNDDVGYGYIADDNDK